MKKLTHICAISVLVSAMFCCMTLESVALPIQRIQGVIAEVGEGFLWLKPDGESEPRKFLLRWKAQFIPPKLPLPGDRVLILYKDKEEGAVIYGVTYLGIEPKSGKKRQPRSPTE